MSHIASPTLPHNAIPVTSRDTTREAVILLTAVFLRLLIIWFVMARFPRGWFFSRGIELGVLARSLLSGQGFSSPFGTPTGPTALLTPGYPVCIALLFRCFGLFTPAAAVAIMTLQMLCSAATILLMMRIARQCFGGCAAKLSGAFWAISLPLLWMPTIFWETCLSALLLTGMLALALRCAHNPAPALWALMGAYIGLASLVNPALLLSLLAMTAWAAWQTRNAVRHLLMVLLVFSAVYAPWPVRNARRMHAFIPLRSTIGLEMWMGNREGATGFLDESVFPLFNRQQYALYVAQGEAAYMSGKSALAVAYIRAHPATFLERTLVRGFRFWTGTGTQNGSLIYVLHALLTSALGGWGVWRMAHQHRFRLALLFLMPLLLFPLPYYVTHAEFRYRLVIDPLLTVLSASAACSARTSRVNPQVEMS